jgi:hypothetical protein
MKFTNEIPKEVALDQLQRILDKEIGGGYIGGSLCIGDHCYNISEANDRETATLLARIYLEYKTERHSYYDMAKRILAGEWPVNKSVLNDS